MRRIERKSKGDIKSIENEIKNARKKEEMVRVANLLGDLAKAYKEKGDMKQVDQIYAEQNAIVTQLLVVHRKKNLSDKTNSLDKNKASFCSE